MQIKGTPPRQAHFAHLSPGRSLYSCLGLGRLGIRVRSILPSNAPMLTGGVGPLSLSWEGCVPSVTDKCRGVCKKQSAHDMVVTALYDDDCRRCTHCFTMLDHA